MTTTRRAYRGGAKAGRLIAPTGTVDLVVACDALTGWPDGSDGMFAVVVGKGLPNEEKMLVQTRTGANLTINKRGYDGTVPTNHSATEPIEHCHTATDDDEANEHSSGVYGHGVPTSDHIVGEKKAATLENKTIDGGKNVLQNIPSAASPETAVRLDDAEADIATLQTGLANEVTNRTNAVNAEATTRAQADTTEAQARSDGDAARYTKAETDARYYRLPVDSGWQTATTGFVPAANWTLTSVRWRTISYKDAAGATDNVTVDVTIIMQRNATALSVGTKGDVVNTAMVTIPAALRPTALINLLGPASGAGRMCAAQVDTNGVVTLLAAGGTAAIASEQISLRSTYIQ